MGHFWILVLCPSPSPSIVGALGSDDAEDDDGDDWWLVNLGVVG